MWKMKWRVMTEADEAEGTPAAEAPVEAALDSVSWDDLLDDRDEYGDAEAEAPAVEVVAEAVGDEAEPEPAPAVVEEAPATPEPPPAPVETVVAEAQPTAPVVSQPQPAQAPQMTEEQVQAWRQQAFEGLAQSYAITSEDASALQLEPEKVLPRLAAQLHMRIVDQVMRSVVEGAPRLVEQSLRRQRDTQAAEDAFYSKWGNLRGKEAQVAQVAQMWRQMYPNASTEEAIEGIGRFASSLVGQAVVAQTPVAATPAPPPPPPAGPSSRASARMAPKSRLSAEEQAFADFANEFVEDM